MQKYTIQNLLKQRSFTNNRLFHFLFIAILLYFGPLQNAHSQNPDSLIAERLTASADSLFELEQFGDALLKYKESSEHFEKAKAYEKMLQNYSWISACLNWQGVKVEYLKYAEKIKNLDSLKNSSAFIWSYLKPLSDIEFHKGNINKSLNYLELIESRLTKITNFDLSEDYIIINNAFSYNYRKIGNYTKSLEYAEKNKKLVKEYNDSYYQAKNLVSICLLYSKTDRIEESIICYHNTLNILFSIDSSKKVYDKTHTNKLLFSTNLNLSNLYTKNKNYKKALELLLPLVNSSNTNHSVYQRLLFRIARNYYYLGNIPLYNKYLNESKLLYKTKYKTKHGNLGRFYQEYANILIDQDSIDLALKNYQLAIFSLAESFNDSTDISKNPILKNILAEQILLLTFEKKAEALVLKFGKTNDLKYLEYALDTYQKTDSLVSIIRKGIESEASRQLVSQKVNDIYEKAIEVAFNLYQLTNEDQYKNFAFDFAEKNKAISLLEVLQENKAKFAFLPDSLIEKETEFKVEIAYNEKKLFKEQKRNLSDSTKVHNLQNKIFDLKRNYDKFQDYLESNFKEYFALKYQNNAINVTDIQNKLDAQSAFIEYFVGDKNIYSFTITKNSFDIYKNEIPQKFNETISDFRKTLTDYTYFLQNTEEAQKLFNDAASDIYNLTLKETEEKLDEQINKIIIVPDDLLNFVNFESLVRENNSHFEIRDFLINDFAISYAYSATHLLDNTYRKPKQNDEKRKLFAGFAPIYQDIYENIAQASDSVGNIALMDFKTRNSNVDLPEARAAVQSIADLLKGDSWLAANATEKTFKNNAADYKILHLAMHGVTENENPEYSKLIFSSEIDSTEDGLLNAYELYNMNLNADLAVLSACNTGFGKLKKGDGTMSLARAFSYAGCPSLVMSLWSVPSEETANIMVDFYKQLKNGESKENALRSAKLNYLKSAPAERLYPFFWAGFIPIGNPEPIFKSSSFNSYLIYSLIFLAIFVGISLLLFLRKK